MKLLRFIFRLILGLLFVGLLLIIALFSICNYSMKHTNKY
jgi:hypothetical protein